MHQEEWRWKNLLRVMEVCIDYVLIILCDIHNHFCLPYIKAILIACTNKS